MPSHATLPQKGFLTIHNLPSRFLSMEVERNEAFEAGSSANSDRSHADETDIDTEREDHGGKHGVLVGVRNKSNSDDKHQSQSRALRSHDRASASKLTPGRIPLPNARPSSKPRKRRRRSNTSTPVTRNFIATLNHTALPATAPRRECPRNREKTILTRSRTPRPASPDLGIRKRAHSPSQPSPEESITCQERPPKRLRVVSGEKSDLIPGIDEPLDPTTQNDPTTATSQPDIRRAIELIRQGDKLSDIAIVESLRAVGFNESEISDPIVAAEPPRPYRTYTPRLDDQNFVVFPIYHPEVRHWTVGIAGDGIIHHYNSLGDGTLDSETEQRIKDRLTAGKISLPESTWTLTPAKSAQQANEKDCGMFTIVNAIYHVCGMHDQIDEDIWPGIIRTWRKIFSKILQSRIVEESTSTPGDLESLGVSVGEMDRDFPLSTAKIQEGFKKALTDTTTRLGKLKNEPGLDTEIARLKMILSLVSETNIPGTPEFAPNVNNQLLRKQELQREIKTLTTRTKKQQAVVDVLGVLCDDWKEDAQRIITEIRRLLLGDYAG
jgi:hypothetical protein